MKKYQYLICGGTFDHFHKGHKEFLQHGMSLSDNLLIGITSDQYLAQHKQTLGIESYEARCRAVTEFVSSRNHKGHFEIEPIDTLYIPEKWVESFPLDGILASPDSEEGAKRINEKRTSEGRKELPIELFPFTPAQDGNPISSRRIRNGEINREGKLFVQPEWLNTTLFLPLQLRNQAAQPLGEVVRSLSNKEALPELLITVGDVVTKYFHDHDVLPHVAVVDLRVERKPIYATLEEEHAKHNEEVVILTNSAGSINKEAFQKAKMLLEQSEKKYILHVSGEEDLVVLPFVLLAPLGAWVFYGQPGKGMVKIAVNEAVKELAFSLVSQFKLVP